MDKAFVTIATYPDLISAQYYRNLLEANGLHPFLPDEFSAGTQLPAIVFTKAGLSLQVPTSEAAEAQQILSEMAERGREEHEDLESLETSEEEVPGAISSERYRMTLLVAGGFFVGPLVAWFLYSCIQWILIFSR